MVAKLIVNRVTAGQSEHDEMTTRLRNESVEAGDYAEGVRAFLEKRAPTFG